MVISGSSCFAWNSLRMMYYGNYVIMSRAHQIPVLSYGIDLSVRARASVSLKIEVEWRQIRSGCAYTRTRLSRPFNKFLEDLGWLISRRFRVIVNHPSICARQAKIVRALPKYLHTEKVWSELINSLSSGMIVGIGKRTLSQERKNKMMPLKYQKLCMNYEYLSVCSHPPRCRRRKR